MALVLLNVKSHPTAGGRALVVGDYVTPKTGPLAGTLGPWSKVVTAVGIAPRSTLMKWIFVVYGLAYLACTALGTDNCDDNATCTNTPGSFTCTGNSDMTACFPLGRRRHVRSRDAPGLRCQRGADMRQD